MKAFTASLLLLMSCASTRGSSTAKCEVSLVSSKTGHVLWQKAQDVSVGAGAVKVLDQPSVSIAVSLDSKHSSPTMFVTTTVARTPTSQDVYASAGKDVVLVMHWLEGDAEALSTKFSSRCKLVK